MGAVPGLDTGITVRDAEIDTGDNTGISVVFHRCRGDEKHRVRGEKNVAETAWTRFRGNGAAPPQSRPKFRKAT